MSISALKMFMPYSGAAASAPGGRGNGATDRVAVWANGNDLTSFAGFTYDGADFTVPNAIVASITTGLSVGRASGADIGVIKLISSGTWGSGAATFLRTFDNANTEMWRIGDFVGAGDVFVANYHPTGGFIVKTNNTNTFIVSGAGKVTLGTGSSVVHNINTDTSTTVGAAGPSEALPATPDGYVKLEINGVEKYLPFYAPG